MAQADAGRLDQPQESAPAQPMMTADGVPLKVSLRKAERRKKINALLLVAPLFLFLMFTFIVPILSMLYRSVDNPQLVNTLTNTVEIIHEWDSASGSLPPEEVFAAMVADLAQGRADRTIGRVGTRLNYEISGMRSLFNISSRRADSLEAPFREALIEVDGRWGEIRTWALIQRESRPWTSTYYLAAIDMQIDDEGRMAMQSEDRRIYVPLFERTLWLSLAITGFTLLLGFPVAYLLANLPMRYANLLMILVLLPFWTSLLVRTSAWIVLLQSQGVLNDLMVAAGLISDEGRLRMMHNHIGTIIAMTHILLPFMVLPLYSVMKGIPPSYVRAARSLGANPLTAFIRVYLPQTVPGIGAGAILVFILSIGYYITPALVGGQSGQLISNEIARHMQSSLNWGLAAALGSILLLGVLALYLLYNRLVGIDNMKLG